MLEKGDVIGGKYQITRLLGSGGMSHVYQVLDFKLQKSWAMKEIPKASEEGMAAVFYQSALAEVTMMKKLDHPMLPRIVDKIETAEAFYIVMDYIEGIALSRLLWEKGAQPEKQVIDWAKELCGVLDYLHRQNPPIIYRDLKPANLILQSNGRLKLIDFGTAHELDTKQKEPEISLGTRGYAAPEQRKGGLTDQRSDIYSLGMTLYHLLTGKDPAESKDTLPSVRKDKKELSLGIEYIVKKCTSQNPKERYQTCEELFFDLNNYEKLSRKYWKKKQKKRNRIRILKRFLKWIIFSF